MSLSLEEKIRMRAQIIKYRALSQVHLESAVKMWGSPMSHMIIPMLRGDMVLYDTRALDLERALTAAD